jgi:hypothetical protein
MYNHLLSMKIPGTEKSVIQLLPHSHRNLIAGNIRTEWRTFQTASALPFSFLITKT